jgi:uncharacterized membrane protein
MSQFRIVIAAVLLIASLAILVTMLFTPQPIQIVLETGQQVATQSSTYFTISTVMMFIICSFIIGVAITYLYHNTEYTKTMLRPLGGQEPQSIEKHHSPAGSLDTILPLLREDEKKTVRALRDHQGELLQSELVLQLGFSKVKTTRIVASLERKGVIEKHRHGLTNRLKLQHN